MQREQRTKWCVCGGAALGVWLCFCGARGVNTKRWTAFAIPMSKKANPTHMKSEMLPPAAREVKTTMSPIVIHVSQCIDANVPLLKIYFLPPIVLNPVYGCRTLGMETTPFLSWKFSRIATIALVVATHVLLSVCTKSRSLPA